MKQTFLDETRIPAFQRGFSPGPSWTDGDGLQMVCGASGYMTGPHWGLDNPLHKPPPPPLNLHCIPQPCSNYQQAHTRERLAGVLPVQNVFSFPNNFFPHPCNVLAAAGPLFLLSFNLPYASSHRGDPKPCRTSRNAKHLQ